MSGLLTDLGSEPVPVAYQHSRHVLRSLMRAILACSGQTPLAGGSFFLGPVSQCGRAAGLYGAGFAPIASGADHSLRAAACRRSGSLKFGISSDTIGAWR
jgi:hypothetical protein